MSLMNSSSPNDVKYNDKPRIHLVILISQFSDSIKYTIKMSYTNSVYIYKNILKNARHKTTIIVPT